MEFKRIRAELEARIGHLVRVEPISGGCIANASRIETSHETFFLKWGGPEVATTFDAEAAGLRALQKAGTPLKIPQVVSVDAARGYLLLEWIELGARGKDFEERFGQALAALHQHVNEHDKYGFERDNFIGHTPQQNEWLESWVEFFHQRRLEPQVQLAKANGYWDAAWDENLSSLYQHLPDLIPTKPPASILHGDLWSGNYLVTTDGNAALIDPACYFGDREADIAMTALFGGFGHRFYEAYQEAWPLEAGYEQRRDLYNLYHLINHLNLFGQQYAAQVAQTLSRFR